MTYQEVLDNLSKYEYLNIDLTPLKNEEELKKFDSYGILPDKLYELFVEAVLKEYICCKFNLYEDIEKYSFDEKPIEHLFVSFIYLHLDDIKKEIYRAVSIEKILSYINEQNKLAHCEKNEL